MYKELFFFICLIVLFSFCRWCLTYVDCYPRKRIKTPHQKRDVLSLNTKLNLMVRFQFCRSTEYEKSLHCHYSQNHSEPELQCLFGSMLMGQLELFKHYSYSIGPCIPSSPKKSIESNGNEAVLHTRQITRSEASPYDKI